MTRSRAGHALRPSVATVAIRARLRAHHHRGLALLDDRVAGGRVATGSQGHRMGPAGYDARFPKHVADHVLVTTPGSPTPRRCELAGSR